MMTVQTTESHPKLAAIALIVAAGRSQRMGFDKITAPLCERPVITWSLEAFETCSDIACGVVVCPPNKVEEFSAIAAPYAKFQCVVPGGKERTDSVLHGLAAVSKFSSSIVAVHDAARPLVSAQLISTVVHAAHAHGAAAAAEPIRDTLHQANAGNLIKTIPRENVWAMQTPQAARYDDLFTALQFARDNKRYITDEVSALLAVGLTPQVVAHTAWNFKITYPSDLELAAAIINSRRHKKKPDPL